MLFASKGNFLYLILSVLQTKADNFANSVDSAETAHIQFANMFFIYDFAPQFGTVSVSKFKDGKVHSRVERIYLKRYSENLIMWTHVPYAVPLFSLYDIGEHEGLLYLDFLTYCFYTDLAYTNTTGVTRLVDDA